MPNIEFNINAPRLQGEMEKGLKKAVQSGQDKALFELQPVMVDEGGKRLDVMTEAALGVILKKYDGNSEMIVTGDYELFPEYMQAGLNDIFANLKSSGMLAGYSLEMSKWSVFLTAEGLGYFNDKQKALRRETGGVGKLLLELADSDDPTGMLRMRFEKSNYYENKELSGMIRELVSEGYIRIPVWKEDVPQYVEIDDSARVYEARQYPEFSDHITEPPPNETSDEKHSLKQYDLFISHASKDKSVYADELYNSLCRLGVKIRYDHSILSWGDNWKAEILEGVDASEFAILVISENFCDSEWTEKELNQLLRRQNKSGTKIILPLLYNITPDALQRKYPTLYGIQWVTSDKNYEEITILFAKELIKRLKQGK